MTFNEGRQLYASPSNQVLKDELKQSRVLFSGETKVEQTSQDEDRDSNFPAFSKIDLDV
jgi:hypothetical protein